MKNILYILLVSASCVFIGGCGNGSDTLQVYSWSDYFSPDVIHRFETEYGCTVCVTSFDSNEQMYSKLKAGATGYDVILPSSYQVELMAGEGMLTKLDYSRLPNVSAGFDRKYLPYIIDTNMTYSVPYCMTYTGLFYNESKIPAGTYMNTWRVMDNRVFSGKISLLDDMREVIGAGLMYNGYSINSENPAEIDKAVETVLSWRRNIRKFDAESYKTEVCDGSSWIGHGYSSDAMQAILEANGHDLKFAYPEEGFCMAFDEFVIPAAAPNRDLAYRFINYMYEERNALDNMNYICGIIPHRTAQDGLSEDFRKVLLPDNEILRHGQPLRGFRSPGTLELYNRAWDRIRAIDD